MSNTDVLRTQKTRMYFASTSDASSSDPDGVVIHYVNCATGISGLNGAIPQIGTSCLDSEQDEFVPGRDSPGQVTVPFNFKPKSAAHQALIDTKAAKSIISWMIVFSDAALAGDYPTTVDSNGRLVSAGPTTAEFLGYISDLSFDANDNDIVRGTLTIQRSGAESWDVPTATLD